MTGRGLEGQVEIFRQGSKLFRVAVVFEFDSDFAFLNTAFLMVMQLQQHSLEDDQPNLPLSTLPALSTWKRTRPKHACFTN